MLAFQILMALAAVEAASSFIVPGWDYVVNEGGTAHCVNASLDGRKYMENNTRWTWLALPKTSPATPKPAGGWPVYLAFTPWVRAPTPEQTLNKTCGNGWSPEGLQPIDSCMAYLKEACPNSNATTCFECTKNLMAHDKERYEDAKCSKLQNEVWCIYHGKSKSPYKPGNFPIFQLPAETTQACFTKNGSYDSRTCGFDAMSGMMWSQRLNQHLIANGIALLLVNPYMNDQWDWASANESANCMAQDCWDEQALDKQFFAKLFADIHSGQYGGMGKGVLDMSKLMVWGYSVGSQMVSWFVQLHASGQLRHLHLQAQPTLRSLGGGVEGAVQHTAEDAAAETELVAGVMFAGGTYSCFLDPPLALSQCSNCNASMECTTLGCSEKMIANGTTPCCDYCCPAEFTEQWYSDHPEDYSKHPEMFMVQVTTVDENSDTCAAINYHNTMKAHGGKSTMMLIPPNLETCYCVGSPDDKAAAGSPYSKHCPNFLPGLPPGKPESRLTERCMMHALGFADAVEPLAKFLVSNGYNGSPVSLAGAGGDSGSR